MYQRDDVWHAGGWLPEEPNGSSVVLAAPTSREYPLVTNRRIGRGERRGGEKLHASFVPSAAATLLSRVLHTVEGRPRFANNIRKETNGLLGAPRSLVCDL